MRSGEAYWAIALTTQQAEMSPNNFFSHSMFIKWQIFLQANLFLEI